MARARVSPGSAAARLARWRWHRNPPSIYNSLRRALKARGFSTFNRRDNAANDTTDPEISLGHGLSLSLDNVGWPCGVVLITTKPEWTMVDRYWHDDPSAAEIASRVAAFAAKHGVKSNPQLSRALVKRLMEWRSPDYPAIKALAQSSHPATEAYDAIRDLMAQYERPDLKAADLQHLKKTLAMVEKETGVVNRSNPVSRRAQAHRRIRTRMEGARRRFYRVGAKARKGHVARAYLHAAQMATRTGALGGAARKGKLHSRGRLFAVVRRRRNPGRYDRIKHQLGVNAEPGHKYKGGTFFARAKNGAWAQWGYGDPASNRRDTRAQALAKAKAWVDAEYPDEAANPARGKYASTLYRLADGDVVAKEQLRRMFMGKIPGPVHRRLLGIDKVKKNPIRGGRRAAAARNRLRARTAKSYVRALKIVRRKVPMALTMPALSKGFAPSQAVWQRHAAVSRRAVKTRWNDTTRRRFERAWRKAKPNPLGGRRAARSRCRIVSRTTLRARINKASGGARNAVMRSILSQVMAGKVKIRGARIDAAVRRGIARGRR